MAKKTAQQIRRGFWQAHVRVLGDPNMLTLLTLLQGTADSDGTPGFHFSALSLRASEAVPVRKRFSGGYHT